jgi:hypothetical protein
MYVVYYSNCDNNQEKNKYMESKGRGNQGGIADRDLQVFIEDICDQSGQHLDHDSISAILAIFLPHFVYS